MIKEGEGRYTSWKKRNQSLSYIFKEEMESILSDSNIDSLFSGSGGHPTILKKYLSGDLSLETLIICDRILGYRTDFDAKLKDPVWESVSLKMKKYSSFLNINVFHYKTILKEIVIHGT